MSLILSHITENHPDRRDTPHRIPLQENCTVPQRQVFAGQKSLAH